MKHEANLHTRIVPDSHQQRAAGDANKTLGAVARFLRAHADTSYCYPCLEDQAGVTSLTKVLKPYPGTPYRFEKAYCGICAHWKPCVTCLSD